MYFLRRKFFAVVAMWVLISSCGTETIDEAAIKNAVRGVLIKQQDDWNAGNIDDFMAGYVRSDSVRYASGGEIHYGWQATQDRFHRAYPDRAAMGVLTFSDLDIDVLSSEAAIVFGRYHLEREADEPTGLFTLLFKKTDVGWQIVHDHTSRSVNSKTVIKKSILK